MDYIKSLLFLIFFIPFLSALGSVVRKNKEGFTLNMLFGYITYSFFQAIGGITVQLFKIDFIIYKVYMIVLMISLIYLIIKVKSISYNSLKKINNLLIDHLKKWYLLYIISFVLLGCALLMTNYLWMGNHQDDGWYLLKVALAPKMGNQYDINYATGFPANLGFVRGINTFELDYAFWSDFLHIYPSVFCKATMAYLNYFLVLCGFSELIIYLKGSNKKNKIKVSLYFLLSIMIFALPQETLANHGLITLQDGWHFSTAMWYGSSIVQNLGPFLFFIPLFMVRKISLKTIVLYIMICVALISKSSQALPLITISSVVALLYLINIYIKNIKRKIILFVCILVFLFFCPAVISSFEEILSIMPYLTKTYFQSPLIIISTIIIMVCTFLYRDKKSLIQWSMVLLILHILIFIPRINNLFINTCVYTFITGRTITTLSVLTVVTAGIYMGFIFEKYNFNSILIKIMYISFSVLVIGVYLISHEHNLGLAESSALLMENPKLIPESTVELSKKLSEISERNGGNLVVETESWIGTKHGHSHTLATHLTIEATNIKNLAAIHRFSEMDESNLYTSFDLGKQMIYENIHAHPEDAMAIEKMQELLDKYSIDVLVTRDKKVVKTLEDNLNCKLIESFKPSTEDFVYYIVSCDDTVQ